MHPFSMSISCILFVSFPTYISALHQVMMSSAHKRRARSVGSIPETIHERSIVDLDVTELRSALPKVQLPFVRLFVRSLFIHFVEIKITIQCNLLSNKRSKKMSHHQCCYALDHSGSSSLSHLCPKGAMEVIIHASHSAFIADLPCL